MLHIAAGRNRKCKANISQQLPPTAIQQVDTSYKYSSKYSTCTSRGYGSNSHRPGPTDGGTGRPLESEQRGSPTSRRPPVVRQVADTRPRWRPRLRGPPLRRTAGRPGAARTRKAVTRHETIARRNRKRRQAHEGGYEKRDVEPYTNSASEHHHARYRAKCNIEFGSSNNIHLVKNHAHKHPSW